MKTNKKKAIRMGLAVTAAALFWGGMYLLFGNDAAQMQYGIGRLEPIESVQLWFE